MSRVEDDPDELGYWMGRKPDPWWNRSVHGYPGQERREPSVRACERILGGREVAAEINQAAMLMHRGHVQDAEHHRIAAGYGGLTGAP